jgi:hypothetical protein
MVVFDLTRPQVLIVSPDAPGYLTPSMTALSGDGFGHASGRGFVYPLLVYVSILGSGNLSGIISIQVVLYWLMLVMLVLPIWIRIDPKPPAHVPEKACPGPDPGWKPVFRKGHSSLNESRAHPDSTESGCARDPHSTDSTVLATSLSLALAVTYLSYSPIAIAARSLGPELLYGFLAIASSVALICAFMERERAGALFVAAMGTSLFLSTANILVKPQWIFGAVFVLFAWLTVLAISRMRLRSKVALVVSMTVMIIAALALPERYLIEKYDRWGTLFGPKTFFCNHADIVVRAAQNKPELWAHLPPDFVQRTLDSLNAAVTEPDGWRILGFNGDRCMYGASFSTLVGSFHGNDVGAMRTFYAGMFIKSVLAEPALYLRKVAVQMWFASKRVFSDIGLVIHATDETGRELMDRYKDRAGLFAVPMNGSVHGFMAQHSPQMEQFVARPLLRLLSWSALLVIGAALLCCRLVRSMGLPVGATPVFAIVILTGAWVGQALTVALSHSFDVGRYSWTSAPLLMAATCLSISLLVQTLPTLATEICRRRRLFKRSS